MTRWLRLTLVALLIAVPALGIQAGSTGTLTQQNGAWDVNLGATFRLTGILGLPGSASLPGTCTVKDIYFVTGAVAGQRLWVCNATNTWVAMDNSYGGEIDAGELANSLDFASSQVLNLNSNTAAIRLPITTSDPNAAGGFVIDSATGALQWYTGSVLRTGVDDANSLSIGGLKGFTGTIELLDGGGTYATTQYGLSAADSETINVSGGVHHFHDVGSTRSISITGATGLGSIGAVYYAPTITNPNNVNFAAKSNFVVPFQDNTAWNMDATNGNNALGVHQSFSSQPSFARAAGSNTNTVSYTAFNAGGINTGAGTSVTRTGFAFAEAGTVSGTTLTQQTAFDCAKLTKANSAGIANNICIKNAGTTVNPPGSAQAIAAAGNTLLPDTTYKMFTTVTGETTMTSTPTVSDGSDGQIVEFANVDGTDSDCIVLQDQGTLGSSGLKLKSRYAKICPRESITLRYSATIGDWVELYRSTRNTPAPTIACGGGSGTPTIIGTDRAAQVTTATSNTSCTVTFGTSWKAAPVCTANIDGTQVTGLTTSTTTTVVTFSASTSKVLQIQCTDV